MAVKPLEVDMLRFALITAVLVLGKADVAMAQDLIHITSAWGDVTAELADNEAARFLLRMLPGTLEPSCSGRSQATPRYLIAQAM